MRAPLLAGLLLLTGCATTPPPPDDRWLVGAWVIEGDECESDAGVLFRADGSWIAYGEGGDWTLRGDRLETTVTEHWELDDDAATGPVNPPERHAEIITRLSPDRYASRRSDGSTFTLVRC